MSAAPSLPQEFIDQIREHTPLAALVGLDRAAKRMPPFYARMRGRKRRQKGSYCARLRPRLEAMSDITACRRRDLSARRARGLLARLRAAWRGEWLSWTGSIDLPPE